MIAVTIIPSETLLFIDEIQEMLRAVIALRYFYEEMPSLHINKGHLSENFVGQELLAYSDPMDKQRVYYWAQEKSGSHAEVDYIFIKQGLIIPVEVKSGHGAALQSMRIFLKSHSESPYGIRFSTHHYSIHNNIHSYPLYAVSGVIENKERLIALIEQKQ